jgi:putative transposase
MKADTSREYRLYPDPAQAKRLTARGHSCRTAWNLALEQRRLAWQQRKYTPRAARHCMHLAQARADLPCLAGQARRVLRATWRRTHGSRADTA